MKCEMQVNSASPFSATQHMTSWVLLHVKLILVLTGNPTGRGWKAGLIWTWWWTWSSWTHGTTWTCWTTWWGWTWGMNKDLSIHLSFCTNINPRACFAYLIIVVCVVLCFREPPVMRDLLDAMDLLDPRWVQVMFLLTAATTSTSTRRLSKICKQNNHHKYCYSYNRTPEIMGWYYRYV